VRLVHDGAYEWVADGEHPLARLHRPPADARVGTFAKPERGAHHPVSAGELDSAGDVGGAMRPAGGDTDARFESRPAPHASCGDARGRVRRQRDRRAEALLEQSAPLGVGDRLQARVRAELAVDVMQVVPKRLRRDGQLTGDHGRIVPLREQ
jgi:hypothetical protein